MKELEVISKVVKIQNSDEKIFKFYSDFRNLSAIIPPEVSNWKSDENSCSFEAKGQKVEIIIESREPNKNIKYRSGSSSPIKFNMWIQLQQLSAYETAARIVVRAELNFLMRNALKTPLKNALDQLADIMKVTPYV